MSRQGGQIHADKNFYFLIQKICVNLPAIRQAGLRPKWDFLYYQVVIWFQEVIVGVIK